jgi:tRNA G18 (ribose-2'-O)-methylase SpoU
MKKKWDSQEERYFGIGIYQPKTEENLGALWRTAYVFGASFVFIIDAKYKKQASDVLKVWSKIPLFQYKTLDAFIDTVPYSCKIVGVEQDPQATSIYQYTHPPRALYLLGSENNGLPNVLKNKCHDLVVLPGEQSLNVAVAGSLVLFDRVGKL